MSAMPGMSGVGMGPVSGVPAQSPSAAANAALEAALSGSAFGAGAGLPPMGGQVRPGMVRVLDFDNTQYRFTNTVLL